MSSITYEVTVNEYYTEWRMNGERHREGDAPAVEYADGTKSWWVNGVLHRKCGPAIEYANGSKSWYLNGKLHREGGPAIEWADGDKSWYLDDELHREDGPAVEYVDGSKEWWINGEELTQEEHRAQTQPAVEMTIAEIEQLLGKRVKVVK
jgi:hypothetical protein